MLAAAYSLGCGAIVPATGRFPGGEIMKIGAGCCRCFLAFWALAAVAEVSQAAGPEALPDAARRSAASRSAADADSDDPSPLAAQSWDDGEFSRWQGDCDGACDCRGGCWLNRLPWRNGQGCLYFGADYLLVKPRFSQSVARVDRVLDINSTATPTVRTTTDTEVAYNYDYQSNYRIFAGYHACRCGGDIQFTYWRLQGDAATGLGPVANVAAGNGSAGQLGNNATQDGDQLGANSSVSVNLYDIDFNKCLSLGGSTDACDSCGCPRWDLRWWAGVRIADLNRQDNNEVFNDDVSQSTGLITARFRGAGPRVGMQGRRYFGECCRFSLFAKGSGALLIGDYTMHRKLTAIPTTPTGPAIVNLQDDSLTRMVPMAEIEVGASYQVCERLFFTAGWLFQAWFDVASSQTINGSNFGPLDTANIMSFDGLSLRAEYIY